MILLFLTVLCFISYALLFSIAKRKTRFSISVLCITGFLVVLSFVVFLVKRKTTLYNISIGAVFSLMIGPLLMFFIKIQWKAFLKHFIPFLSFTIFSLFLYPFVDIKYPEYICLFNQILVVCVVLFSVGYSSYGYICYIKKEIDFRSNQIGVCYLVLLFCCSFFFSIVLFVSEKKIFDSDYIFMMYCLCMILIALFYEINSYYTNNQYVQEMKVEKTENITFNYFHQVDLVLSNPVKTLSNLEPNNQTIDKDEIFSDQKQNQDLIEDEILTEEEQQFLRQVLYENLIENQLFLNPELTLTKFSNLVKIDKKKLQDYFRESQAYTFKQYINRLRVEFAISVIYDKQKNITVEELTALCGFNTRVSFYRAFVNIYGFPPSRLLNE